MRPWVAMSIQGQEVPQTQQGKTFRRLLMKMVIEDKVQVKCWMSKGERYFIRKRTRCLRILRSRRMKLRSM
jgi:hypothetical protein